MRRGRGPQLEDPFVRRIVRPAILDCPDTGFSRNQRRRKIGLTGTQVDNVFPRRFAPPRFGGNGEGRRGFEMLEVGGETVCHCWMAPYRLRIVTVESIGRARTTPR